mmetsp:Transcript_3754/g.8076  ORF Transcript_3754/g.8076 Transcript_3754/m.8076 type:complete len:896 (+) Transcript_3754:280-2967(+)
MIQYANSSFGVQILLRFHGSALWKSALPALISTIIYISSTYLIQDDKMHEIFLHPYPMQALVTAFTFLLVFRANYSYNRWWEAYTAVYLMHSKWLDLATEIAAFHYQSKRYDAFKPPSFGANPEVQSLNVHAPEILLSNNSPNKSVMNAAEFDPFINPGGEEFISTPKLSPVKRNCHKISSNGLARHSKIPTMTDLIQQMDDCEAKEAEMNRQSELMRETDDTDCENEVNQHFDEKNEIYSGEILNTDGDVISRKNSRSWLRKISDRRSEARMLRKSKKIEKHRRRADAIPLNVNKVVSLSSRSGINMRAPRKQQKSKGEQIHDDMKQQVATRHLYRKRKSISKSKASHLREGRQLEFRDRFDEKTGNAYSVFTAVSRKNLRAGHLDPDAIPPLLFLEECAHLLSLLSAVAFSTLRNDLPEAESPLTIFEPGLPWPQVDPDNYRGTVRKGWTKSKYRIYAVLQYVIGRSRNEAARTLYNAARPFRVIGNVSDAELEKLQEARGPLAKVTLVSMWLLELISREYQAGSTGNVAPPIISRLYQFVSEGMAGYNQARKIAHIPFPFPHAQITTLFMLIVDFIVTPLLMTTYVTNRTLGFFLNLSSVMCFTGLHEVAREIENPFQNVPNDVPLNNYQAQFNEGLMVMFYGYHPDAYWDSGTNDHCDGNEDKNAGSNNSAAAKGSIQSNHSQSQGENLSDGNISALGGKEKPKNCVLDSSQQQQHHSENIPTLSFQTGRRDSMHVSEPEPKFTIPSGTTMIRNIVQQQSKGADDAMLRIPNSDGVMCDIIQEDEGSLTNSISIGNLARSKNSTRTEKFLHNVLGGTVEQFSDSFHAFEPGVGSFPEFPTEERRKVHGSVLFRIPKRSDETYSDFCIPRNDSDSSLILAKATEDESLQEPK